MKQILCVVDFSEGTEHLLEVAANLVNAENAKLIVLFAYRLISYGHGDDLVSLKARLESEAKEKFEWSKNSLPALRKASCDFHAEIGFLEGRISAYLAKKNIDMVIICQQQVSEGDNMSNPDLQNLVVSSRVPMVVVPRKAIAGTSILQIKTT